MDAVTFFKNINKTDRNLSVTKKWTVKDILSHLVGWEREVAKALGVFQKTGESPWFVSTGDYSYFNEKIYQEFKNAPWSDLLSGLEKWQVISSSVIKEIGEERLRQSPHAEWIFDEGEESHFEHHMKQIQRALEAKRERL